MAMKASSHCGPGRKRTSAGRYGRNGPVPVGRAAAEAVYTTEPKKLKP